MSSRIEVVQLVSILPMAVWIDDDLFGSKHVMVQHGGHEAFNYASFFYDYAHTSNAGIRREAERLAIALGATEPVEYRRRPFPIPTPAQPFDAGSVDARLADASALPAVQGAEVVRDAEMLTTIKQAIHDYHFALDSRKHGGVAQDAAFGAICTALGMHWHQGKEAALRSLQGSKETP